MVNTTVSFVCVTYNHSQKMIQDMITSVDSVMSYCPSYDYDIILVDNSEVHVDMNLKGNYLHIIYADTNLGYCQGNNLGIENSNSDYIIVINPDIIITNSLCIDWLIGTAKFYNSICGTVIGTSSWYTYTASFPTDKKYETKNLPFFYDQPTLTKPGNWKAFKYIDGCLMSFSKELWADVGGFDGNCFPGYFGENIFAFKASLKGYKIKECNIKSNFKHVGGNQTMEQLNMIKNWSKLGREYFYENYALPNWDEFLNYMR